MPRLLHSVLFLLLCAATCVSANNPGDTRIAKWQGDKKAVFLLMFDDSWPSHFQVAVPELLKRQMTGTFYINPAKGEYKAFKQQWEGEKALWKQGMVYGNHTMSHQGVKDMEDADREIGGCTEYIKTIIPGNNPRLISWAQPGVGKGKWNITGEQLSTLLAKYQLVDRPTFRDHGAVYHMQTAEQMLALADKAITKGEMEYVIIHGLERREIKWGYQDFWPLNLDVYRELLDGLAERQSNGDLWITDHISYHQYLTERASAKVNVIKADDHGIELQLSCDADSRLYDESLTLITYVPTDWTTCRVTQNETSEDVSVNDGMVQFSAIPGSGTMLLTPIP